MNSDLLFVARFLWENFLNIWPYLLLTIPLAVAVNLSGASRYIERAFQARPLAAIFLATAVGAFSPFCSCTVIPVVASLLIGGVPLAPVMAFWIASPSMDPEIFLLSVAELGWSLALWRLAGTLALSLGAGLLTHLATRRGWLGTEILRANKSAAVPGAGEVWRAAGAALRRVLSPASPPRQTWKSSAGGSAALTLTVQQPVAAESTCTDCCAAGAAASPAEPAPACAVSRPTFTRRLARETWAATRMVVQFMLLAFLLEALMLLFVPEAWIAGVLGEQNGWAVPLAALLGVPVYTSNLTALPLVGGLLNQGMDPAAALAFLIAGPTTTLPAMAAVWGLVRRRVFAVYVGFALLGAIALGIVYGIGVG